MLLTLYRASEMEASKTQTQDLTILRAGRLTCVSTFLPDNVHRKGAGLHTPGKG